MRVIKRKRIGKLWSYTLLKCGTRIGFSPDPRIICLPFTKFGILLQKK